jgi:PAS domain S-box-containing protein
VQEEQVRARTHELETANRQLVEFRRLVSSVRDYAIFMIDPAGHILSWNAGARRLKGYEDDEIIGRHFSVFYTPEDRARRHPDHELDVAIREGRYEEEGWRVRKDRTRFWASVTITAVRDDDGRLTGFAKVTRDLTSRREADLALRDALEELRVVNHELDRFAAVAAHDLTDPLRTISGFAELLERADLPDAEHEYARHIRESGQRLMRMLQGLLVYARAGRRGVDPEPVDLGRAVGEALADLAGPIRERHAEVTVVLEPGATVLAGVADVRIVLQNLVSNAVKFSDAAAPRVRIEAQPGDGGTWRVTVEDNGPGIAPADEERIFGAFERGAVTDAAGYGLGLAICRRLIERHGGEIGLDAAPGEGSRFWFSLTAGSRPPASSPPSRPPR